MTGEVETAVVSALNSLTNCDCTLAAGADSECAEPPVSKPVVQDELETAVVSALDSCAQVVGVHDAGVDCSRAGQPCNALDRLPGMRQWEIMMWAPTHV